jgi:hypothetical protein
MEKPIEIWVDGRSIIKKGSGFSVVLISETNKWVRSFAYGKYNTNKIDLLAVKFGLLSLAEPFKKHRTKVFSKNDYIIGMFERDERGYYKQNASSNVELVTEIRDLIKERNVMVVKSEGQLSEFARSLTTRAIEENKLVDMRN